MYKQHNKDEVRSILAKYKVGKLAGGEAASVGKALEDPFKNDPPRHPALITRSAKPCNAETPGSLLAAQVSILTCPCKYCMSLRNAVSA
jgi:sulfite oxidase